MVSATLTLVTIEASVNRRGDAADKMGMAAQLRPAAAEERPPATTVWAGGRSSFGLFGPFWHRNHQPRLRHSLLADIGRLQSNDEAADWVYKNLATKNTLIAADADMVEPAFP